MRVSKQEPVVGVGVVITAKAGPTNELLPAGSTVIVIGLGPHQIDSLLNGNPAWIDTPEAMPDVLLIYGRDARAIGEAIEAKLGIKVPMP